MAKMAYLKRYRMISGQAKSKGSLTFCNSTAGTSLDDARAMAEEVLTFHIEGLIQNGEAIPEPSALEEIMSDPDNRSGVTIFVATKNQQPKIVRVNVTLPGDVLEQIDRFAEAHGYTRSGLLTQAAKKFMEAV
jgi:predicted RNase H-like HicB family nuclease